MKKELVMAIIGLALTGIFITSCATAPPVKYFVCADGRQVLDANQCALPAPQEEEPEEPPVFEEPEPEEVKVILTDAAKTLFDKSSKVKTLLFYYVESPNTMPDSKYYMSREKMKVQLTTKQQFDMDNPYDTVYLDLVAKTAMAYCEKRDSALCIDKNRIFDASYDDFIIITPFEWLNRITWADVTGKSKMIDNRNAVEVEFKIKESAGTMFVDGFFGIPMIVTYNGKTFDYRELAANMVNSTDLEHQLVQ